MGKFFRQLFQQAAANRAIQGFGQDLLAPTLRGIGTTAPNQIRKSIGAVTNAVTRPVNNSLAYTNQLFGNIISPRISGYQAKQLVRQTAGRTTPSIDLPASGNAARYTQDAAQRFLQEFGNAPAVTAVRNVVDPTKNNTLINTVGGLFKPSSVFSQIPVLNTKAGGAAAQLLGLPTGLAGTMLMVSQLEGDTPQSSDPFGNWKRLGYASKDEMMQRVSRQAQLGAGQSAFGQRQGPLEKYNVAPDVQDDGASTLNNFFTPPAQQQLAPPALDPQAQMRERAVAQEKSRIEQLTRQNPDMQRYSSMRKTAAAPGATTAQIETAEKLGEEIWRKKYGATALGKEGGVVGSYNPLMQELLGYQAGGAPMLIGPGQVVTPAPVTRLQ